MSTVLDVARWEPVFADPCTGRGVATSHATVDRLLHTVDPVTGERRADADSYQPPKQDAGTVRSARRVLAKLGLERTVMLGANRLTKEQHEAAEKATGTKYCRFASIRCLTLPWQIFHLLLRSNTSLKLREFVVPKKRAQGRVGAAARRSSRHKTRDGPPLERPVVVQRLAAGLAAWNPHLVQGHIGRLCAVLTHYPPPGGWDGWTPMDLLDAIATRDQIRGKHYVWEAQNPVGLLITQLQDVGTLITEGRISPPRAATGWQERAGGRLAELAARDARERTPDMPGVRVDMGPTPPTTMVPPVVPDTPRPPIPRVPRRRPDPDPQAEHDRFMAHVAEIIAQARARANPPAQGPHPGRPTRVEARLADRDARIEAMLAERRAAEDHARAQGEAR